MFALTKSNKVVSLQSVTGYYYNVGPVLQSVTDCCYKVRQTCYKVLQSVTDFLTESVRY